jgi:hypothetical protein
MATNHKTTATTAKTPLTKDAKSSGIKPTGADGIPASRTDTKEETRLFQRSPDQRVWLTRGEAKKEGFFWEDNPDEKVNPPN